MAIEIKVPALGESLVDAVVGQWLKDEGDEVSQGETILEVETDKVNLDVAADSDGVMGSIHKQEGDVVTVGEVLDTLETEGAATAASNGKAKEAPAEKEAVPAAAESQAESATTPPAGTEPATTAPTGDDSSAGRA